MNNIDIEPFNDKGQEHGLWEVYYHNGNLIYKSFYHNGKEVGYEEWYSDNGKLNEKVYNL